jgi:hypothetical protein
LVAHRSSPSPSPSPSPSQGAGPPTVASAASTHSTVAVTVRFEPQCCVGCGGGELRYLSLSTKSSECSSEPATVAATPSIVCAGDGVCGALPLVLSGTSESADVDCRDDDRVDAWTIDAMALRDRPTHTSTMASHCSDSRRRPAWQRALNDETQTTITAGMTATTEAHYSESWQ